MLQHLYSYSSPTLTMDSYQTPLSSYVIIALRHLADPVQALCVQRNVQALLERRKSAVQTQDLAYMTLDAFRHLASALA